MRSRQDASAADGRGVVILGGGFAGLMAAHVLGRAGVGVTLVDRRNFNLFQPLLYQVATAALSPADIAVPLRQLLRRHPTVRVLLGEAVAVDVPGHRLTMADGPPVPYRRLVLCTGSRSAYFGRDAWETAAPGLKTIEDALEIRRRVLTAFERAERAEEPDQRRFWQTFVVIGGGPTGVELAGAVAELAHRTLRGEFRWADPAQSRVILVEAAPALLPGFPPSLGAYAARTLGRMGVDVRLGQAVEEVTAAGIRLGGDALPAATVLWAAGVAAAPIAATLGVATDRQGRLPVTADLRVPGAPDVWAAGDVAAFVPVGAPALPGLATVALQQGRRAAQNVLADLRGAAGQPFRYHDRGKLATLGRGAAVGEAAGHRFTGFSAWLVWIGVHIAYLTRFEDRLLVLLQWGWSYVTSGRRARLITGPWRAGAESGTGAPAAARDRRQTAVPDPDAPGPEERRGR